MEIKSVKVILIGNTGVGKTCFVYRILENDTSDVPSATIAANFSTKRYQLENFMLELQIWDTAGQERFASVTSQYVRNTDFTLLFLDITSKYELMCQSYEYWYKFVTENSQSDNMKVIVVFNKIDLLKTEEEVNGKDNEIDEFCKKYNIDDINVGKICALQPNAVNLLDKIMYYCQDPNYFTEKNKNPEEKKKKENCC